MSNFRSFDGLQNKKRKPLWKRLTSSFMWTFATWVGVNFFLNFGAYSQIIDFKWKEVQAASIQYYEDFAQARAQERQEKNITQTKQNLEPITKNTSHSSEEKIKNKSSVVKSSRAFQLLQDMSIKPSDNRIYIPKINKNIPLVDVPNHKDWNVLENNIQEGLRDGVVVHPISRIPSVFGNFFVTGHSSYYQWDIGRYKDVFALLHEVEKEDILEVYWEGRKYTYRINIIKIVAPTAVEVLNQPENKKIITLMTCTPVGTNKNRLILVGDLISED